MINEDVPLLPNRWQTYIGVIAEPTTKKNQRWFHIYVPEFLPTLTGDVSAEFSINHVTVKNVWGRQPEEILAKSQSTLKPVEQSTDIHLTKTIYADYMGFDTGADVPTMYRGMQVLVINLGNTDKWYWIPLERDRNLKTFEHVRLTAINQAVTHKTEAEQDDIEARNAGVTDDNTYFIEIDTKYKKGIRLRTSSSDGEAFRYRIDIDTEASTLEICDEASDGSQPTNRIKMESKPDANTKGKITLQNAAGATIVLNDADAVMDIPGNMVLNVKGTFVKNVTGDQTEEIGGNKTFLLKGNETSSIYGTIERNHGSNVENTYAADVTDMISGTHLETQKVRTTVADSASLTTQAYNLTADVFNVKSTAIQIVSNTSIFTLGTTSITVNGGSTLIWPGATIIGRIYPEFNGLA